MVCYCLKKIEQDGTILYEGCDIKNWTSHFVYACFYETIEDVLSDMKYHKNRDEYYLNTLKEYGKEEMFKPCKYEVAKFEINEIQTEE